MARQRLLWGRTSIQGAFQGLLASWRNTRLKHIRQTPLINSLVWTPLQLNIYIICLQFPLRQFIWRKEAATSKVCVIFTLKASSTEAMMLLFLISNCHKCQSIQSQGCLKPWKPNKQCQWLGLTRGQTHIQKKILSGFAELSVLSFLSSEGQNLYLITHATSLNVLYICLLFTMFTLLEGKSTEKSRKYLDIWRHFYPSSFNFFVVVVFLCDLE